VTVNRARQSDIALDKDGFFARVAEGSMPLMPVRRKTSKNGLPGTAWPQMLNRASRTISGVGRHGLVDFM